MKRRLPLIFVAVVTVICLVAASVAAVASGVNGSAVAYQVNGTKVSQATVDQDLKALADAAYQSKVKQVFAAAAGTTDGAVSSSFTATWLDLQIRNELFRQAAEKANVSVGDRREGAAARGDRRPDRAERAHLQARRPAGAARGRVAEELRVPGGARAHRPRPRSPPSSGPRCGTSDIRIDPRYGRWSPTPRRVRTDGLPQRRADGRVGPARCRAGSSSWASDRPVPTTSCRWRGPRSRRRRTRFARTARHPAVDRPARPTGIDVRDVRRGLRRRARSRARVRARSRGRSSTRPASTARWCTRYRAIRPSPSARSRCCATSERRRRAGAGRVVRRPRLGAPRRRPDGGRRTRRRRPRHRSRRARGPVADRAVRQRVRAVRREARAARAPRPGDAAHRVATARIGRRTHRHGRVGGARPRCRGARSPHVGVRRRRCGGRGA